MNRFQLFCSLVLLSFAIVHAHNFESITFSKGKTIMPRARMLDGVFPNTSTPHVISEYGSSFSVYANFSEDYMTVNQMSDPPQMQIMIYTSQSALSASNGSCYRLENFACDTVHCAVNSSSPVNVNLPFFNSTGLDTVTIPNSTILSLANDTWRTSSMLYLYNCDYESDYFEEGYNTLGWVGLGLSAGGNENFVNSTNPVFSILINNEPEDDGYGELLFGYEPSYVNPSGQPITLITDQDWKTNVSSISWELYNLSTKTSSTWNETFTGATTLVFDVQTDSISLPVDQYRSVMRYLINLAAAETDDDDDDSEGYWDCNYSPDDLSDDQSDLGVCNYYGADVSTLNNLNIALANGTILSIPPSAYMDDDETQFRPFDSSFANANYTVFGTNVMSNYYTVFSQTNGVNTLTLYPRLSTLYTDYTYPTDNTTQPVDNTTQPVDNTTQPVDNTTQPVDNTTKPVDNTTQPVDNTTQPVDNTSEPNGSTGSSTTPNPTTTSTTTSQTTVISDGDISTTASNTSDSGSKTAVIVIVSIVVVVAISIGVIFIGMKQGWWLQPKRGLEEPTLGVELRSQGIRTGPGQPTAAF